MKANRARAYRAQFEEAYGRDETKLDMWQSLCRDLGVEEGSSITQCKKALKGTYVNIVDFLIAKKADRPVKKYNSYKALQHYIRTTPNKIFPLKLAKESPILNWMLITL